MGIYSCLIFLILLGRAAFVFPLSALANYMNRRTEETPSITFEHQVIQHIFVLQLPEKMTFYWFSKVWYIVSDNHLVGWPNEGSSLHCVGFQTGMCMKFSFLDIVITVKFIK